MGPMLRPRSTFSADIKHPMPVFGRESCNTSCRGVRAWGGGGGKGMGETASAVMRPTVANLLGAFPLQKIEPILIAISVGLYGNEIK